MWISWKHQDTDFTIPVTKIEDKIDIFCERIWGWQLHIADLCLNGGQDHKNESSVNAIPHSGFGAMQIMLSYFEMIAKYQDGFIPKGKNHKAGEYFRKGVKSVFPQLNSQPQPQVDDFLTTFYEKARCGLYHMSQTSDGIELTGDIDQAMCFNAARKLLIINPHRLPAVLKDHLSDYRGRLQNAANAELRQKFQARFDFDNPSMIGN